MTEGSDSEASDLVLIGAGGFARETAQAVHAINAASPSGPMWRLRGYLDDDDELRGAHRDGLPVIGRVADALAIPTASYVVCTGRPDNYFSRKQIVGALGLKGEQYATLIHPGAHLGQTVRVGVGSVLLAGVVATSSITLGDHVAVMPGVMLTHDDVVEDFVTLATGATLAGAVRIAEGAYIGSRAAIREGLSVGAWALVGMGAVVLEDVGPGELWAGNPARLLRRLSVPLEL